MYKRYINSIIIISSSVGTSWSSVKHSKANYIITECIIKVFLHNTNIIIITKSTYETNGTSYTFVHVYSQQETVSWHGQISVMFFIHWKLGKT